MKADKIICYLRECSKEAGILFATLSDLITLTEPGTTLNYHLEDWKTRLAQIAHEIYADRVRLLEERGGNSDHDTRVSRKSQTHP